MLNADILKNRLDKQVFDGKIVDVKLENNTSLGEQFKENPKLSSLSTEFEFYSVRLNNKHYVLGIHIINSTMVRKIRLSLHGIIMEDVLDNVINNGLIKRTVTNNHVYKR